MSVLSRASAPAATHDVAAAVAALLSNLEENAPPVLALPGAEAPPVANLRGGDQAISRLLDPSGLGAAAPLLPPPPTAGARTTADTAYTPQTCRSLGRFPTSAGDLRGRTETRRRGTGGYAGGFARGHLPTVLAAEEKCSRREAVVRTAAIHDELVPRFEQEAAPSRRSAHPS